MKKNLMKLIGLLEIICIVASIIIPVIAIWSTESYAGAYEDQIAAAFKENIEKCNKLIAKDTNNKYGLYVNFEAYLRGAASSGAKNHVSVDTGIDVCIFKLSDVKNVYGKEDPASDASNITPKKNADYEIDTADYKGTGIVYETPSGSQNSYFGGINMGHIDQDLVRQAKEQKYFNMHVTTPKYNGKYGSITFDNVYENKIIPDLSKDCVALNGNTLIMEPGSSIKLSTQWTNERDMWTRDGTFSVEKRTGFSISNNNTISAPNSANAQTQLTWQNKYGTKATLNVITGYLTSGKIKFNGMSYITEINRTTYHQGHQYTLHGEKNAIKNKYSTLFFRIGNNGAIYDLSYVSVKDITGVTDDGQILTGIDSGWCRVDLKTVRNGFIEIKYKDYNGNWHANNIWINVYDVGSSVEETPENKLDDSEKKDNNNNNNGGSTPSIEYGNVASEASIDFYNTKLDGNKLTINVDVKNAAGALWNVFEHGKYSCDKLMGTGMSGYVIENSTISFDISKIVSKDGKYDVVVMAVDNANCACGINALGTWQMGPSLAYKTPSISATKTSGDNGASMKFDIKISDCTEAYYSFVKRELNADGTRKNIVLPANNFATAKIVAASTTEHNKINGIYKLNATGGTLTIHAQAYDAGYFDLIIWAKNHDDDKVTQFDSSEFFIDNAPQTMCTLMSNKSKPNCKVYNINAYDSNKNDKCEAWYCVQKYDEPQKYEKLKAEDIKSKGTKFSGVTEIKLEEKGIYNIAIYVVDMYGVNAIQNSGDIFVSNPPEINYVIRGEKGGYTGGYTYSTKVRDVQTIDIGIKDDEGTGIVAYYFVSDKNYSEEGGLNEKIFSENNATKVEQDLDVGIIETIPIESDGGKQTKYLYIMAYDKHRNGVTIVQSGSIIVDDTDLELEYITTNKEKTDSEIVGFAKDEDLQVRFQFNHEMKECDKYPKVFVEITDDKTANINKVELNEVTIEANCVVYHKKIEENTPNGIITDIDIDYTNSAFEDDYAKTGTYNKQITEDKNIKNNINGNYYIDSVCAKITSMEIMIETNDESNILVDESTDVTYIKAPQKVDFVINYSEPIINLAPYAACTFANRGAFFANSIDDRKDRIKDEYDLKSWIDFYYMYEGDITVDSIFTIYSITDKAGNEVEYRDSNLKNIKYLINGEESKTSKIIFDNNVDDAKVVRKNEKVVYVNDTLVPNEEITAFAEYSNKKISQDASGIDKLQLDIWCNGQNVIVNKKNGSPATQYGELIFNSENEEFTNEYTYIFDEDSLPITIQFPEEGTYKIIATKTDKLGNESDSERLLEVKEKIAINEDESGFLNIGEDEYVNVKKATDNQKEFVVSLKLSEDITKDNILVKAKQNYRMEEVVYEAKYKGSKEIEGITYEQYSFNAKLGGTFQIIATETSKDEQLLNTYIERYNLYSPTDTDYDGLLTQMDVIYILQYIARFETDIRYSYTGDVDNDGSVNISDTILLSRAVAEDLEVQFTNEGYLELLKGGNE